jgi:acyl-CoA reductase-like NAD-dependent aldehyde dehydrogenase
MEMVLKNVSPNMRVAQEEVFSPVAPVIIAEDEMEGMRLANDSQYSLRASKQAYGCKILIKQRNCQE